MDLENELQNKKVDSSWQAPQHFILSNTDQRQNLEQLFTDNKVTAVCDFIDSAIGELFDIRYPAKKDTKLSSEVADFKQQLTNGQPNQYGVWVFYPWTGRLVHFPPADDYRLLRTARNRNLITADEQVRLQQGCIMVAGLSVGSSAVEMLLSEGIGGRYVLVDMDIIEPTNLNRIKLPYHEVGVHKVDAVAKRISEIDPFIEQIHYRDGLNETNVAEIFEVHRPDVVVDEMDDLRMKVKLRQMAKEQSKPVLMATDDGENALLDIERYDTNPDQQMFEGRLTAETLDKVMAGQLSRPEIGLIIGKDFVGFENVPLRMFESLGEVGKTIPSWPQLAGAATLSGVVITYAAKKIMLAQALHGGRHLFDLDAELDPVVGTEEYKAKLQAIQQFLSSPPSQQ